ncbi:MAG: dUTP diphosphatase [Pseudomonadota bacterium]
MSVPPILLVWTDDADRSLPLPQYETEGSAGADIRANFPIATRATGLKLAPGGRDLVPTGLRMAIPNGFEVQLRPRSGLALKQGLMLANSPGTIDSDYRGPLGVILLNAGAEEVQISHGERIAQMILTPVTRARFEIADSLDATARGAGGFGSTGSR